MSKTNETPPTPPPEPEIEAQAPATTQTTAAVALKPVVQYGSTSIELHLVPGGRAILVSSKTKLAKLDRDPALEDRDPNVKLVLAMAAGPAFVEAVASGEPIQSGGMIAQAYAKSQGS